MNSLQRFVALGLMAFAFQATAADALRPEVGQPLQEAQTLIQGKQYKDALAKVNEAQAVEGLTAYESYIIERMKSAAATGAGDYAGAIKSYETVLASGKLAENEKLPTLEALAKLSYASKNYPKAVDAIQKYQAAGGTNAQVTNLLPQAYYLAGSYAEAQKAINAQISQTEKAGQSPSEDTLKLLASTALKQNDNAGYVAALEKLVEYHPTPNYWLDLITRTTNQAGFAPSLALDVYRLRKTTGTLSQAGQYMEAAQLALQAGYPGEAQSFVDEGYQKQLLGTGADAARHQRLKDLVAKKIAEDKATLAEGEKAAQALPTGDALVSTGYNYVAYGQYDKGIPLMQQGIDKGVKTPDHAKLQMGYALMIAGDTKAAGSAFKAVKGKSYADVARMYELAKR